MTNLPITPEQATKKEGEVAEVKGNQYLRVDAYLEPASYLSFYVKEDFYKYYGCKPVVATDVKKAVPKKSATTTGGTAAAAGPNNKGNGVSYKSKSRKLPDKKIKVPTTGGDAPLVHSKTTKRKKFMVFRVPSYMPAAAVALWINTAFDTARRPTYFILESGTRVEIDPSFTDPTKLKAIKSFKTDSDP